MVMTGWYNNELSQSDLEDLVEEVLCQFHTKLEEKTASDTRGSWLTSIELTKVAALAGKARAIAGPMPLHKAPTPSVAIVFLAQSKKPE